MQFRQLTAKKKMDSQVNGKKEGHDCLSQCAVTWNVDHVSKAWEKLQREEKKENPGRAQTHSTGNVTE